MRVQANLSYLLSNSIVFVVKVVCTKYSRFVLRVEYFSVEIRDNWVPYSVFKTTLNTDFLYWVSFWFVLNVNLFVIFIRQQLWDWLGHLSFWQLFFINCLCTWFSSIISIKGQTYQSSPLFFKVYYCIIKVFYIKLTSSMLTKFSFLQKILKHLIHICLLLPLKKLIQKLFILRFRLPQEPLDIKLNVMRTLNSFRFILSK